MKQLHQRFSLILFIVQLYLSFPQKFENGISLTVELSKCGKSFDWFSLKTNLDLRKYSMDYR